MGNSFVFMLTVFASGSFFELADQKRKLLFLKLAFCLATLGIMFLILTTSRDLKGKIVNIVMVYGKVPLFYFIVHFYLIHLAAIAMLFFQGFSWTQLEFASGTFGRPRDTLTYL